MLGKIVFFALLTRLHAACSDYYTNLVCDGSNPAFLKLTETSGYDCHYTEQETAGNPPIITHCNLTCENDYLMLAYLRNFGNSIIVKSAHFDSKTWKARQENDDLPDFDIGTKVKFGCMAKVLME